MLYAERIASSKYILSKHIENEIGEIENERETERLFGYKLRSLSHFIHDAIQMLESDSFNR